MPPDLEQDVIQGRLTMVDCEAMAWFLSECLVDDLVLANYSSQDETSPSAGLSTFFFSDNSPTVGIAQRQASRAKSRTPERLLRLLSLRQRWLRRGPQDVTHYPGVDNKMADIPSRSFVEGYPDQEDDRFLRSFSQAFPLPPQLGSWKLVRPRIEISSLAFSILRGTADLTTLLTTPTGNTGVPLPALLGPTLTWPTPSAPTSTWNEATCSWPLLLPCGTVSSHAADLLQHRKSRRRFDGVPNAWSPEALRTLANQIKGKPI